MDPVKTEDEISAHVDLSKEELACRLAALTSEAKERRAENDKLRKEILKLREKQISQHITVEQEEEYITNRLLNHIRSLKKSNVESPYQSREINQQIENLTESEQDLIVNKLKNQQMANTKESKKISQQASLTNPVSHRRTSSSSSMSSYDMNILPASSAPLSQVASPKADEMERDPKTERLKMELHSLQLRFMELDKCHALREAHLLAENEKLMDENFILRQSLLRHKEKVGALQTEKEALAIAADVNSESEFNAGLGGSCLWRMHHTSLRQDNPIISTVSMMMKDAKNQSVAKDEADDHESNDKISHVPVPFNFSQYNPSISCRIFRRRSASFS